MVERCNNGSRRYSTPTKDVPHSIPNHWGLRYPLRKVSPSLYIYLSIYLYIFIYISIYLPLNSHYHILLISFAHLLFSIYLHLYLLLYLYYLSPFPYIYIPSLSIFKMFQHIAKEKVNPLQIYSHLVPVISASLFGTLWAYYSPTDIVHTQAVAYSVAMGFLFANLVVCISNPPP